MLFHNRFSNLNIEYMEIRFILKKYIKKVLWNDFKCLCFFINLLLNKL
jgi:hypothetical protein